MPLILTEEKLLSREARCICGQTVPSTEHARLAFFEYRGPGSDFAEHSCKHCRYHDVAHGPGKEQDIREGKRPRRNVVEEGHCPGFEAGPHEYDSYYCGCRGWD